MEIEKYILKEDGEVKEYVTRIPKSIYKVCNKQISLFNSEKSLGVVNFHDDFIHISLGKNGGVIAIEQSQLELLSKLIKLIEITEGETTDIELEKLNGPIKIIK